MPTERNAEAIRPAAPEDRIVIVGMNYRTAPLAIRERFALTSHAANSFLSRLRESSPLEGGAILNTCNRVEIIAVVTKAGDSADFVLRAKELLAETASTSVAECAAHFYEMTGVNAVRHLFRVSSGLDSMVLGEPQILGQVKDCYERARKGGFTSPILNRLFQRAFRAAKGVRTNTALGRKAVSLGYAAVELASQIFGDLSTASLLLLGTGQMGSLTVRHFASKGVKRAFILSRSLDRAADLARSVHAIPAELSQLETLLPQADIVIGCADASVGEPLVSGVMCSAAQSGRSGRPQFFIDLGVPRNFDSSIESVPDCFLYSLDDLEDVIQKNFEERAIQALHGETLVQREVDLFQRWISGLGGEDHVARLYRRADALCEQELIRSRRRIQRLDLPPDMRDEVEAAFRDYGKALLRKLLAPPVEELRRSSDEEDLAAAFHRLHFGARDRSEEEDESEG
ncbi:MAG: glutamyl-tRNA reductase [Deltaproteobacteria bacterium]|nr:glutamyl-tRNA reductase [Deltaproteobacteria bacterium]